MAFPEGCKPKKENGMGLMSVAAQAAAFNIKAIIQLIACTWGGKMESAS
jgi:hypothetical protein